jgi:hypothetical protein
MKRFIQILLTVLLTLGTSTAIWAAPPDKVICNSDDVYERLECKQQNIADQLHHTSANVFGPDTKLGENVTPARRMQLNNASIRADRAAVKNNAKVLERQVKAEARGQKGSDLGHLVPLGDEDDFNQDDICDYEQDNHDAECAAIELNDDGELQACNPEKKNKGKGKKGKPKFTGLECDRWFESDDGDVDITGAEEDLEGSYSAMEDSLFDMNVILDDVNDDPEESTASVILGSGETEENCTDGIDNDDDGLIDGEDPDCMGCAIPETNTHLANSVIALRELHATLAGLAGIASAWAGQTVVAAGFGGNTKTAQMPFEVAAAVANIAYIAVDEANKLEAGNMQAAIMDCSAQTANAVAALIDQVAELKDLMQQQHKGIVDNDDENTTEIIQVLNTPHGQREKSWKP